MRILWVLIFCFSLLKAGNIDISGIYKTHKGTDGGQSIVEIFKSGDTFYVYGLKNLEREPIKDSCNKNAHLRERLSVGNVFAYGYSDNGKGQLTGGQIYNFNNCKFYYSKIIPKSDGTIEFVGALDSYYIMHRGYIWEKLSESEAAKYAPLRKPIDFLLKTANDTKMSR
ncbi:DUF2147 domain-containing protein [Helicobacter saguini]|uniref:DUF2147 domain-containing protein n=1 Tax=Helicobacter saguini TaxID=1548018 RepID=A0A347VPZ4_9HELI|nr:DUF2147 domain-containing protein [Helicobacter saguini]MWV61146.1 DUF2147 domain-containing protein [Helicobacter saguini]MWV68185.1 DUF2147 domain-containing protein [Helicobacter saguini]MWV70351.1 DUF2147 domain-containing protein [Helicobacter saguini]MWV72253.1 DUF2147 domain-containing protein [Helicobacter saguini]TLD95298.1 DUF2147 domain-containing protein [Helicobacter saguini]